MERAPRADSTGGLLWHWRALRARRRWQATTNAIAQWLSGVHPPSEQLLLVGASAGWMMDSAWLSRFARIEAIDFDPLAPPLFAARHGATLRRAGSVWAFHRVDAMQQLEGLLERWPRAAILFDNVLGQQRFRRADGEALEHELSGLHRRLARRHWGSVHDWMSGPARPSQSVADLARQRIELGIEADGLRFEGATLTVEACAQRLLARLNAYGNWQDHLTSGIFPVGTPVLAIPWAFGSTKWHWLHAAWLAPEGAPAQSGSMK